MRLRIIALLILIPIVANAQRPLVSHWEKIGPVNFTALVQQSPTQIVAATDHGYLYITRDDGTTWQRREVDDTTDIQGVAFGDSLRGALIASGKLMLTSDGGATWNYSSAPLSDLALVGALDANTFFIGASVPTKIMDTEIYSQDTFVYPQMNGLILRSTDAGANWDTVLIDTNAGWWSPPMKMQSFFGRVYVIGASSYAESLDGGAHWSTQTLTGALRDIDFYNRDTGAIASTSGYYVTTDGGEHWKFTPEFHDERNDSYMALKFFGPTNFFLFGTPNAYYFTVNSLTDTADIALAQMPEASSVSNVIRTESGNWVAVGGGVSYGFPYGGGGYILHGSYDPETMSTPEWTILAECPFTSPVNFHASNGAFFQCTADSYPLYSTDSGFFWHPGNQLYNNFVGMHFTSADTAYLYGSNGMMTTDSGKVWKLHAFSPSSPSSVAFGSDDTGYGVLNGIVRTLDGGATWLPAPITLSDTCPYAGYKVFHTSITNIVSPDGNDAFILTNVRDTLIVQTGKYYFDGEKSHSELYRTSDGGASWELLPNFPITHVLSGVYFKNSFLGFVLAGKGELYRTSDGGESWVLESPAPSNYTFNSINFLNDRIGFLSIDTEAVLATTDGGVNWNWLAIPTNREEILNRQGILIYGTDTIENRSGMSTHEIFFPDSNTVLVAFGRSLAYYVIPPKDTVINGDTIVEFQPSINTPISETDYGFYRAKLNLQPASAVRVPTEVSQDPLAFSIYPNPATNETQVEILGAPEGIAKIEILDLLGQTLLTSDRLGSNIWLDLHELTNGAYMMRCTVGKRTATSVFTVDR